MTQLNELGKELAFAESGIDKGIVALVPEDVAIRLIKLFHGLSPRKTTVDDIREEIHSDKRLKRVMRVHDLEEDGQFRLVYSPIVAEKTYGIKEFLKEVELHNPPST